jgi:hypothetical protein
MTAFLSPTLLLRKQKQWYGWSISGSHGQAWSFTMAIELAFGSSHTTAPRGRVCWQSNVEKRHGTDVHGSGSGKLSLGSPKLFGDRVQITRAPRNPPYPDET